MFLVGDVMKVHLDADIFQIVKDGVKDVEIRINDNKRRKLKVGDTLIFFKRPADDESITVMVLELNYYRSFRDVVDNYEMRRIYLDGCSKEDYLRKMSKFYTEKEQDELGVVAIIFEKV